MFEQLFGKLSAVVHHKAAPYATERERFLEHCAQQGYSTGCLKKLAATLLVAAYELHSHGGLRASPEDLETAADRVQQLRSDLHRHGDAEVYREVFIRTATQWLLFAGYLRVPTVRPRPFAGLMDDFAQWMAQERGLSPQTIRNRRWHVERFLSWLDERNRHLVDLRLQDVDAFFEALHAKGLSRVTIKIYANGVRAFLRHAETRVWCPPGLANLVAGPRIYRHHELPVGPSWDEVRKLIESTASDDPADVRDRAIIMLFAVYGLRAGEVAGLRLEDIDWEQDRLDRPSLEAAPEPSLSARPLGRAGHHPLSQGSPPTMLLAPGVSEGPRSGRAADLPEPLSDSRDRLKRLGIEAPRRTARTRCGTPAPVDSSPRACRSRRSATTSAIAASTARGSTPRSISKACARSPPSTSGRSYEARTDHRQLCRSQALPRDALRQPVEDPQGIHPGNRLPST